MFRVWRSLKYTITYIDRGSASRDTAHANCTCIFSKDISKILAYIFPTEYLIEFETIFSAKSLSESDLFDFDVLIYGNCHGNIL